MWLVTLGVLALVATLFLLSEYTRSLGEEHDAWLRAARIHGWCECGYPRRGIVGHEYCDGCGRPRV